MKMLILLRWDGMGMMKSGGEGVAVLRSGTAARGSEFIHEEA
jgi:hypothetical protein